MIKYIYNIYFPGTSNEHLNVCKQVFLTQLTKTSVKWLFEHKSTKRAESENEHFIGRCWDQRESRPEPSRAIWLLRVIGPLGWLGEVPQFHDYKAT